MRLKFSFLGVLVNVANNKYTKIFQLPNNSLETTKLQVPDLFSKHTNSHLYPLHKSVAIQRMDFS